MPDEIQTDPPPPWPPRPSDAHKGSFGRALIVAGSWRFPGAAVLAARACLRGGAGIVTVAVPDCLHPHLAVAAPSATWLPLACTEQGHIAEEAFSLLIENAHQVDAVGIGPGLGTEPRDLVYQLVEAMSKPLVIDADGLNALVGRTSILATRTKGTLLTPHPGEFTRLSGSPMPRTDQERRQESATLAQLTESVILLKGQGTIVTDGRRHYRNSSGNAGMATGGSGDVLTGLLVALLARGVPPFDAARIGAWVHGLAGDILLEEGSETSLIAEDLIEALPRAFRRWEGRS